MSTLRDGDYYWEKNKLHAKILNSADRLVSNILCNKKISKILIDWAKFLDSKNKQNITKTSFSGLSTEAAIFQKQSDLVYQILALWILEIKTLFVSVGLLVKKLLLDNHMKARNHL